MLVLLENLLNRRAERGRRYKMLYAAHALPATKHRYRRFQI